MTFYKRICKGINDRGILIPKTDSIWNYIDDSSKDYYESLYLYNEDQKKQFDSAGSVAGIQDVVGKRLYWDFDDKNDLESAAVDAYSLVERLGEHKFPLEALTVYFSGNKGFGLEFLLSDYISVDQFKHLVFQLAGDLKTFDRVVNNPSRIIRVPNTQHSVTNLFKVPITTSELGSDSMETILEKAKAPRPHNLMSGIEIQIPSNFLSAVKAPKQKKQKLEFIKSLDFSQKPKEISNCRWALQNGYFKEGVRSTALLALASYYKNRGFDQEIVYRMLKGVAELQAKVNNQDRFPDEEIYNNIIIQVFADSWKGGQYSCREPGNFLYDYCRSLGDNKCDHEHDDKLKPRTLLDVQGAFKTFVDNIEKNTITTGIPAIDENLGLITGSNVLLLGAPASGKTALTLKILRNTSKMGIKSVFASLDMSSKRLFEKVLYGISGKSRDELYHTFQVGDYASLMKKLQDEYGNVFFYDGSAPTVQDIRDYIIACQEKCGEKIKLVMVDYFERISSDMSDDTASSKRVAGELQDLVNDLDICLITLVQPNKMSISGGPDSPLYSYTNIKGSSFVFQAARQIVSIWRPFATAEYKAYDKYLQLAILKNDLGELDEFVFKWNGKRGEITEMDDHDYQEFEELMERKERESKEESDW